MRSAHHPIITNGTRVRDAFGRQGVVVTGNARYGRSHVEVKWDDGGTSRFLARFLIQDCPINPEILARLNALHDAIVEGRKPIDWN